jgi:predicted DNA-binding transcriptional regulator YafY
MKLVAENEEEYKKIARVQKVLTAMFKNEKAGGSEELADSYKLFINTPVEKSWVMAGTSASIANAASMDTDERALIIPYLVHAAVNRKKCAIEYVDGKGKHSKRLIEPMNWAEAKSGINIVSWCHEAGAWRHFNPKNIMAVAVTEEDFDRDEDVTIVIEDAKEKAGLAG